MVLSLTQTKGLLSAIAGTAARQSTAHIPIAISRITDPASSRVELRRSSWTGGGGKGYLLPNWETKIRVGINLQIEGVVEFLKLFIRRIPIASLKEASPSEDAREKKGGHSCRLERRRLDSI